MKGMKILLIFFLFALCMTIITVIIFYVNVKIENVKRCFRFRLGKLNLEDRIIVINMAIYTLSRKDWLYLTNVLFDVYLDYAKLKIGSKKLEKFLIKTHYGNMDAFLNIVFTNNFSYLQQLAINSKCKNTDFRRGFDWFNNPRFTSQVNRKNRIELLREYLYWLEECVNNTDVDER